MKKFSCKCGTILNLPENKNISSFSCPNCKRIYKPQKNPELNQERKNIIDKELEKRLEAEGKKLDQEANERIDKRHEEWDRKAAETSRTMRIVFICFCILSVLLFVLYDFRWFDPPPME